MRARRDAEREPLAQRRGRVVEHELRGERRDVDRPARPVGGPRRRRAGRPQARPRTSARRHQDRALERHAARTFAATLRRRGRQDEQRHLPARDREEHRNEHELRRDREAGADLEQHARRRGVRDHERRDQEERRRALRRRENRERDRRRRGTRRRGRATTAAHDRRGAAGYARATGRRARRPRRRARKRGTERWS